MSTYISIESAQEQLAKAMHNVGIDIYISPSHTYELFDRYARIEFDKPDAVGSAQMPLPVKVLLDLTDLSTEVDQQQIMGASLQLWNSLIAKYRPVTDRAVSTATDIITGVERLHAYTDHLEEALKAFRANDHVRALTKYQETFRALLSSRSVTRSLYRILCNTGVVYLVNGESVLGEYLVRRSGELCPTYTQNIQQKRLIEEGRYDSYMYEKMSKNIHKMSKEMLDPFEVKTWSVKRLMQEVSSLGISVNPDSFAADTSRFVTADDALREYWTLDKQDTRIDNAYILFEELSLRLAPDHIYAGQLHEAFGDLEDALYPQGETVVSEGEQHTLYKEPLSEESLQCMHELYRRLSAASDVVIEQLRIGTREYADYRQNLIFAWLLPWIQEHHMHRVALADIIDLLARRTHDRIYAIKDTFQLTLQPDVATVKILIDKLTHADPLDHTGLLIVADQISGTFPPLARDCFLSALDALDKRVEQKRWQYPPYDYQILAEHYVYIVDQLENLMTKEELEPIADRISRALEHAEAHEDPITKKLDSHLSEIYPDDPVLAYLAWFDTLHIDLTQGDGLQTRIQSNHPAGHKIGRNDPCICGATKPNGKPLKFKLCCGRNA